MPRITAVSPEDVLNLLQKVARVGGEPVEILRKAGIPYSPNDIETGRFSQLSRSQLIALYRESIVTIGWHSSRLDRKPQMHPDEFRLMCHCVITSRTFCHVIERQTMFFGTRHDRISTVSLEVNGTTATVLIDTMRRRKNFSSFLSDLAGMSMFCRLYGWLLGIGEFIFRVGLAYDGRYADEAVSDFFAGELSFDHPVHRITFPAYLLDMPIVRTPDELEGLLVDFPFDFLSATPDTLALPDRVRSLYIMSLSRDRRLPSLDELARLTGYSTSTLRRRLADEAISIHAIKEETQKQIAIELLGNKALNIDAIALRSGFRDTNSFRKAFRRWTGQSPSQFRQ
ncbi:AraC family transcriptional regulator [Sphingomonas sp. C3-2]|uniref:AraC family transcriptional regulator n=1 Tax=Sphingomonas sp. C3-2 TaxID=3062169 RepID=UPI00294AD3D3|nr:helix-turn-helix domain-containing protein [Sphingomonas sp. C3-2]WOK36874.1 helix-turn-helix domain-containing protein [Sphingomonas sp. C3-2]